MKKIFSCLLVLVVFTLCACTADSGTNTSADSEKSSEKKQQSVEKTDSSDETNDKNDSETDKKLENSDVSRVDSAKEVSDDTRDTLSGKIIVVDAGHGRFSKGRQEAIAPGSSQTKPAFVSGTAGKNQSEEELNLSVALKLKKALEDKGATVHMTRETHETTRSNIDRAQFANDLGADISVKLHADGSENTTLRGISMLIPGNQHVSDEIVQKSTSAGEIVLEEVVSATGAPDRGTSVRNDMTGFNWSTVPVILLEMGFMSNPEEDTLMETDDYQNKIVVGIVKGLERYFE